MKKFYPVTAIKAKLHDYKLRHLRIGKVKNLKKDGYTDFKIVNISWDVHWMTNLYLAVIIRDYLRFFIKNTRAIGNCVIEEHLPPWHQFGDKENEYYWNKWESRVNTVADEFDILAHNTRRESREFIDDAEHEKMKEQTRKAFADLAEIFADLCW